MPEDFEYRPNPDAVNAVNYLDEEQAQADKQQQLEEEQTRQLQEQQKEAEEKEEEFDSNPLTNPGGALKETLTAGLTPALGALDFASDVAKRFGGEIGQDIDNWWDTNSPRSASPIYNAARDVASIALPSMLGGLAVSGTAKALTIGSQLPKSVNIAGNIMAWAGVDAAVTNISEHSERDLSVTETLVRAFGSDKDWSIVPEDDTDARTTLNTLESVGFSFLGDALGLIVGRNGKATKITARNPNEQVVIDAARPQYDQLELITDPPGAAVGARQASREAAQTSEGLKRLAADPDGVNGYDPFINVPAEPQAKAVVNIDADPIQAKVDLADLDGVGGTGKGRAAPVATQYWQDTFLEAPDGTFRGEMLNELTQKLSPEIDAIRNGRVITEEAMQQSIDNLVNKIYSPDFTIDQFRETIDVMKLNVFNSQTYVDDQGFKELSMAFKKTFDEMWNPDNLRASAMITQNAADDIADISTGAKLIGDVADTSRQQEMVWDKLELMAQEIRTNQYISGRALQAKKIAKSTSPEQFTAYISKEGENFDEAMKGIKESNYEYIQALKKITGENPEWLKPIMEEMSLTLGSADPIFKMNQYLKNKLGFWNKAFVDGAPEMPSLVVQGIQSARYNSILLGMAPIRAAVGGATLTMLKPATVLIGAGLQGDAATFKRALYSFGGIMENFQRGMKLASQSWTRAIKNPTLADLANGRADIQAAQMEELMRVQVLSEKMAEAGLDGHVAMMNITKLMGAWNNNPWVRGGTNAMQAIDGFTRAFNTSMVARAKAYDEVFDATNGTFSKELFNAKQRELYDKAFKPDGTLKDTYAEFASREMAYNLDNGVAQALETFMRKVPGMRPIMMFARTGLNGLEMAWSFTPVSGLSKGITRASRALKATTPEEIAQVLLEHGAKSDDMAAFKAIQSEYFGRQAMGYGLTFAVATAALNGNVTGNGPQDAAEKRRMMELGWKPLSIKNPFTGQWHSYQGLEPIQQVLSITSDAVYQARRVDQSVAEDLFRKISYATTMNVSNMSFLSNFRVVTDLIAGDPGAWNRFAAGQIDSLLPAAGIRSMASKAITPQLKDVENDMWSYLANRNKWLFSGDENLRDLNDVYTGKPINYMDPLTAAANAFLPFFKTNGGGEPWREWLINTGWDGLNTLRRNPRTGQKITSDERAFVNNWIGENWNLVEQIEELRSHPDKYWDKQLKQYRKALGLTTKQEELPIKQLLLHKELDRIHDEAFKAAWDAWEYEYPVESNRKLIRDQVKGELRIGNVSEAAKIDKLLKQTQPR